MKHTTVLRLKLVVEEDTAAALHEMACRCRQGRNAGSLNWMMRQHGLPESAKQAALSTRKTDRFPIRESRPKSESTKIYHAVASAVEGVPGWMVAMLSRDVHSILNAKVDWRRQNGEDEKPIRRSDLILQYEDALPKFTAMAIPLHNQQYEIVFEESGEVSIDVANFGFIGRHVTLPISRRGFPPSRFALLTDIADGKRKLQCSDLVYKQSKNSWYWHLPVEFETERRSDVEITLWPVIGSNSDNASHDRPFRVAFARGRDWHLGDGRYLKFALQRLVSKRKEIGARYRDRRSGAGHGRKKYDHLCRRIRKQQRDLTDEVRRRAIVDVIKQCDRESAGVVVYREPSLWLRDKCWFKASGLDWDWTRFRADLKNALARKGIELKVRQYKKQEAEANAEI